MTYLAPRQGLFAIILLVSFCLQTLLLVISTDQQLSKSRALKGEQMVAQLIDEARLSLENKDRVSLSVIANRYTSEQDVTRILIKDSNDDILVPVGNAPMQQGDTIRQIATKGDAVIGSVALTLKDISKGEIIAMQWPFVIGMLLLHLLLWLIYGYLARPTKEQINAISRDISELHREQFRQLDQRGAERDYDRSSYEDDRRAADVEATQSTVDNTTTADASAAVRTLNIHGAVNSYIRGQQGATSADADTRTNSEHDLDISADINADISAGMKDDVDATSKADSAHHTEDRPSETSHDQSIGKAARGSARLSATRTFDSVRVQIVFHDEFNMLERLAPAQRLPYLALCTQLLNQATTELLKQPLLLGVSMINEPSFDDKGASVLLKADNSHAKVALAGVMLGKLYLMLNKIIHDKHIELSRFALPAKAGVSDDAQSEAMTHLLHGIGKKEQMLILLPNAGLKQISHHVQVQSVMRPTTVYERECAIFDGGNDAMIQRLADVRNAVLMVDNQEAS
ncbi:hypothetical protein [Psychrobacter halodurans]|uniref:Histidine kinase BarA N-terminal domain-containing protein n=1 Tax=Psychrobacter halodurans TaxID=2818439 RepID=A0AAW4IWW9_9GAMM|nr:hypothetical protein [Psychrobacter halodurans]MBO1517273.1 hypothetical protein [Psychrobacter halodurans]